jgi:hypothetical protein
MCSLMQVGSPGSNEEWISDTNMDANLEGLSRRYEEDFNDGLQPRQVVLPTWLMHHFVQLERDGPRAIPRATSRARRQTVLTHDWFRFFSRFIQDNPLGIALLAFLINGTHWVCARFEVSQNEWTVANPYIGRPIPAVYVDALNDLVRMARPVVPPIDPMFRLREPFAIGAQLDNSSCGYLVLNAIHHRLVNVRLLDWTSRIILRLQAFNGICDQSNTDFVARASGLGDNDYNRTVRPVPIRPIERIVPVSSQLSRCLPPLIDCLY